MKRSVSIVGAGRVGKTLGKRLRELGWRIGAVLTRSIPTSRAAVRVIGAGIPFPASDRAACEALRAADLILICTPDQTMAGIVRNLAGKGSDWRGKVVLHTSGALDHTILTPLARCGAHTGSMHPMQTFSGKNVPHLDGVTFAIEGDANAVRVAQSIAHSLGGVPVKIAGSDKPAYHATAVLASGSGFALIESSLQILTSIGFTRRQALETLLPLIRQMLDNIERLGPRAAWTGPLSRGDYAVVAKHMRALRRYPREFALAYAVLARLAGRVLAKNRREANRKIDRAIREPRR